MTLLFIPFAFQDINVMVRHGPLELFLFPSESYIMFQIILLTVLTLEIQHVGNFIYSLLKKYNLILLLNSVNVPEMYRLVRS